MISRRTLCASGQTAAHKYCHLKLQTIISDTCLYCKKLQKSNKSETENTCTVDITKQDIQSIQQVTVSNSLSEMALPDENDVTLCENDDNYMSIILNKIFPDCPDKMKTFCFHKNGT
jgi:hypothetical protein